jgi:hypothetical protein
LGAVARVDLSEQCSNRNRLAVLGNDLRQNASRRRRYLDRHLVGLQLDQRFVGSHEIAAPFEPFPDGGLGYRFTKRGNPNFGHEDNS